VENSRPDWNVTTGRKLVLAQGKEANLRPALGAKVGGNDVERSNHMPFDGIESLGAGQLAKLGAVERLLATEQQWCKGRLRDAQGRHCLVGAIEAVEGRQMLQRVILHAAREVSGKRYWRIEFFNDDPHTTHSDVLEVLHRARENIIAGMTCDTQPWHRRWARALRGLVRPYSDAQSPFHPSEIIPWHPIEERAAPQGSVKLHESGAERRERSPVLELLD
jgi:hypothetical protein